MDVIWIVIGLALVITAILFFDRLGIMDGWKTKAQGFIMALTGALYTVLPQYMTPYVDEKTMAIVMAVLGVGVIVSRTVAKP